MTEKTQPTDAEIDALWALLTSAAVASPPKFAREVLARWGQPAHSGEPVAWLSPWREDQVTTDYDAYGEQGIPLYTAPQPVEREPLTDEQWQRIADLTNSILTRATKDEIERVIGIKGGQNADT